MAVVIVTKNKNGKNKRCTDPFAIRVGELHINIRIAT